MHPAGVSGLPQACHLPTARVGVRGPFDMQPTASRRTQGEWPRQRPGKRRAPGERGGGGCGCETRQRPFNEDGLPSQVMHEARRWTQSENRRLHRPTVRPARRMKTAKCRAASVPAAGRGNHAQWQAWHRSPASVAVFAFLSFLMSWVCFRGRPFLSFRDARAGSSLYSSSVFMSSSCSTSTEVSYAGHCRGEGGAGNDDTPCSE